MVTLTEQEILARANSYLCYLMDEWSDLPNLAAEWAAWDDADRLDFRLEWSIREDCLMQLQEWDRGSRLAPEQHAELARLLTLIADYRPILEELLQS